MYRDYGFIAPRSRLAEDPAQAAALAAQIGFPVALKIASPDILHKTDVGGVELGLRSEGEVRAAYGRILLSVGEKRPEARIEGVLVEEMCQQGVEIIIGLNNDPQFGPVIMFGLGGIFANLLQDVSFRVLPISRRDAAEMIGEIRGKAILEGYRGQPPVSRSLLIDLLMNAARMGRDLGERLESVDFNPIVVWEGQHRVLDAKILLRESPAPRPGNPVNTSHLDAFFEARSVAVVGASATPGKIGYAVLDSLVNHEYRGRVYPVNPGREQILGLKAYPSLASIPEVIDLAVVTAPLAAVPELIGECASLGIHNLVIISGGGKELGGKSGELEATIKAMAQEAQIRIIGCNCIGVFDGTTRLDTFFQINERMVRPRRGAIAMITQSGTVGAAFLEAAAKVGVSKFVSYGNRIDVDEADLISYLVDDAETEVIALYVEGFSDGRKFFNAAKRAAWKKPLVVYKAGRSQQAAQAAVSHTGFFGGSYGVVRGAFAQAGIIGVDSMEELYAVSKALALQPRARGNRLAMISNGAGTLVQAMDILDEFGLRMATLTDETLAALRKRYPPYYVVKNPIDVTGSGMSADYEAGIEALARDPQVDLILPWFVFQDTPLGEDIVAKLARLNREMSKPLLVGASGGPYTRKMSAKLEAVGVPVFHTVREWISAARGLACGAGWLSCASAD